MKKFEKNQKYDTQLIGKIVETYKFAKKQGDRVLMQRQANLIYEFTKKICAKCFMGKLSEYFKKSAAP